MVYRREALVKTIKAATEGENPVLMTMRDGSVHKIRFPIVVGSDSITFQSSEWHDKKTTVVSFDQIITVTAMHLIQGA